MSTTVCGVRFSDPLAALLDHAAACDGWRVEADTRGRSASGVIVYPADKAQSPITVEERKAQFNRAHYENLRRQLDRAGLPPMPAEVATAAKAEEADQQVPELPTSVIPVRSAAEALAKSPAGTTLKSLGGVGYAETPEIEEVMADPERSPEFVATVAAGLAHRAGLGYAESDLVGQMTEMFIAWALATDGDKIGTKLDEMKASIKAEYEGQIATAMQMAQDAEARAIAAERARDRMEEREAKARADCGAALDRAKTAEAEAERLGKALAPLRALLNEAS